MSESSDDAPPKTLTPMETNTLVDAEIQNLKQALKRLNPPMNPSVFTPPPFYKMLQANGENDPRMWRNLLQRFWATVKTEPFTYNDATLRIAKVGSHHQPLFITRTNTGVFIYAATKRTLAMAFFNRELDG
jgi:hypothetical protein